MKKKVKQILASFLAAATVLTSTLGLGAGTVSAATAANIPATQNIVVHKYQYNGDMEIEYDADGNVTKDGAYIENDGTLQDAQDLLDDGWEPYSNNLGTVKFTLVDISSEYTSAQLAGTEDSATVDEALYDELKTETSTGSGVYVYDQSLYSVWVAQYATVIEATVTDGIATFTNVRTGAIVESAEVVGRVYMLLETTSPDEVSTTTVPIIVHLPMTVEGTYPATIHLYAKNQITQIGLDFTKYSESITSGSELAGVTFELYSGTPGTGSVMTEKVEVDGEEVVQARTFTTNALGKLSPTIEDLPVGNYYLVETDVPDGYLLSNSAADDANNKLTFEITAGMTESVAIKFVNFEKPDVTKVVTNGTDTNANGPSYDIGSVVTFNTTIDIPTDINGGTILNDAVAAEVVPSGTYLYEDIISVGGTTYYAETTLSEDVVVKAAIPATISLPYTKFLYTDIPVTGLTYSKTDASLVIESEDETVTLVEDVDYTYVTSGTGFRINFIMSKEVEGETVYYISDRVASLAGESIVISYQMTINSDAAINSAIDNTYTLEYNNAREEGSKTGKTPITTGGYKFVKTNAADTGYLKLGNAQFLVRKLVSVLIEGSETEYESVYVYYYKNATTGEVTWVDKATALGTQNAETKLYNGLGVLTSSSAAATLGEFEITGLAFGVYELEEVLAPDGYQLLKTTAEFTVSATSYDYDYVDVDDTDSDGDVEEILTKTVDPTVVKNHLKSTLPITGGMGTVIFSIIGIALMGIAILFYRRSMRNAK